MKITIKQDPDVMETEVIIKCRAIDDETERIISQLGITMSTMVGRKEDETYFVPLADILYFESVEGKIFFYTSDETYECSVRLYQIEEDLSNTAFARISKTVIANLNKMRSIKTMEHGRLMATLNNGEKVQVSRQYVAEIKRKLGV